jgi:hypothetical protein
MYDARKLYSSAAPLIAQQRASSSLHFRVQKNAAYGAKFTAPKNQNRFRRSLTAGFRRQRSAMQAKKNFLEV